MSRPALCRQMLDRKDLSPITCVSVSQESFSSETGTLLP
jgi:hypothetical protein